MSHPVAWLTPAPLWEEALKDADRRRFGRPELLRFARDTFMDDLQGTLEADARRLPDFVASGETWRDERAGWRRAYDPDEVFKLYQPAHQRFYLVAATLVCRVRGLPDKGVERGEEEAVSFVVRRLLPRTAGAAVRPANPATYREYGWFGDAGWQVMQDPEAVDNRAADGTVAAEERLPMFPLHFEEPVSRRRRRLLAGFIPAAKREAYEAASREAAPAGGGSPAPSPATDPLTDPRGPQFEVAVRAALESLQEALEVQLAPQEPPETPGAAAARTREAQDVLGFALLDLAEFLKAYAPAVWTALQAGRRTGLNAEQAALYDLLGATMVAGRSLTWRGAVVDAAAKQHVLLGGPRDEASERTLSTDSLSRTEMRTALVGFDRTTLAARVSAVLAQSSPPDRSTIPGAPPDVEASAGAVYVVRCVYERPRCARFGIKASVSPPSQAFRLASFFDPDAPVRPVRISLPVDTSTAGLRKFPKNVSFLLSNQLRQQIDRVQHVKLEDLDKGEIGEAKGIDFGMICSLSIPIITICALILLMIIVQLLNIVFWWLPFFKICFPLNLKVS